MEIDKDKLDYLKLLRSDKLTNRVINQKMILFNYNNNELMRNFIIARSW